MLSIIATRRIKLYSKREYMGITKLYTYTYSIRCHYLLYIYFEKIIPVFISDVLRTDKAEVNMESLSSYLVCGKVGDFFSPFRWNSTILWIEYYKDVVIVSVSDIRHVGGSLRYFGVLH